MPSKKKKIVSLNNIIFKHKKEVEKSIKISNNFNISFIDSKNSSKKNIILL